MTDQSWTLTVGYDSRTNITTITDSNGGTGDEVIFAGETDTITFVPGPGVRSVTRLDIKPSTPAPSRVTIHQQTSGNNLIVTDTNNLLTADGEADLSYSIAFSDSAGVSHTTDPKLINTPQPRINTMVLTPAPRRALALAPRILTKAGAGLPTSPKPVPASRRPAY